MDFVDILTNDDRIELTSYSLKIKDCEGFDQSVFKSLLKNDIKNIQEFSFENSEGEQELILDEFAGLQHLFVDNCEELTSIKIDNSFIQTFTIKNCPSIENIDYCLKLVMSELVVENCIKLEVFESFNKIQNIANKKKLLKKLVIRDVDSDFETEGYSINLVDYTGLQKLVITDSNLTDVVISAEQIKNLKEIDLSGTPYYEKYGNDLLLGMYKGEQGAADMHNSGLFEFKN